MKKFLNIIFGRALVVAISIIFQFLWLFSILHRLNSYYVPLSMIANIIGILMVLGIVVNRDNPAYKLVWAVVILALPVFGVFLYAFVGQSKVPKKMNRRFTKINERFDLYKADDDEILSELGQNNDDIKSQCHYLSKYSGYGAYKNTDVDYFSQTDAAYNAMLEELSRAEKYIFMEYFAMEDAHSFKKIEDILEQKVKDGVEVRIIYDDFGSLAYVNNRFIKRLLSKGIKVRAFNPLVPVFYIFMNNRDHRKIMVIDGRVSFNGGFNMCDEYFNIDCPYGHWKDTAVRLRGDAVRNHVIMFLQMWNSIEDTDKDYSSYFEIPEYKAKDESAVVIPFSDSPLDHECVGENAYLNIIRHASRYVYIFTPYLIIDNEMMEALCLAAKSGVDIRIVTPGIPDKKIVYMLTKSYYPQLLEAGVRIYHYTPGFIHAKCYVCDDEVGVVGTINMDYRSLYLHFECGTYIYNSKAIADLKKDFFDTFEISEEVHEKDRPKKVSLITMTFKAILRLFAPLM